MKLLSRAIAAIPLLLAAASASAQGVPTIEDLKKATDAAMETVGRGDLAGGLKSIQPHFVVSSAEFESMVGQANLALPVWNTRFGASRGHEFIEEKRVGSSLVRLTYIHKFDMHATRWHFYSYRGKNGWSINTLTFDDKLQELF